MNELLTFCSEITKRAGFYWLVFFITNFRLVYDEISRDFSGIQHGKVHIKQSVVYTTKIFIVKKYTTNYILTVAYTTAILIVQKEKHTTKNR